MQPVVGQPGALEAAWTGSPRWAEVTVGLIGEAGAMRALPPTLLACQLSDPQEVKP